MDMTEFNTPGSETASIKREDSPLNQELGERCVGYTFL